MLTSPLVAAEEQKLDESGHSAEPESASPLSWPVSTVEALAADVAHYVNNPLTVVLANVELLADMVSRMEIESGAHLETPEARDWLRSHLTETEVCLSDMREAAERMRLVIQNLKRQSHRGDFHVGREQGVDAFPIEPETDTKSNVRCQARILVVDDQEDVAKVLGRMLRGHEVVVLVSAREALARIVNGERFDAILCDLMIPELPGFALFEEITRLAPDQAARMIFMTGGATSLQAEQFLDTVAQPVLAKPIEPHELRAVVQKFLR